ncbi:MAG: hypothetical protein LWX54_05445 [Deltaproteobacteria bacterium]|jgi:hypothetical protein|nr:hypothetical protein [Deltaproteobacteria bacterium]
MGSNRRWGPEVRGIKSTLLTKGFFQNKMAVKKVTASNENSHVDIFIKQHMEPAQTLVNTVNVVGAIGKEIALEFKRRIFDVKDV